MPDAQAHFIATYRYSNILLDQGEWTARADDAWLWNNYLCKDHNASTADYWLLKSNFHLLVQDTSIVDINSQERMTFYSIICYLPQVLGFTIGRLLGLGTVPMIYLGRVFTLIIYVAVIYRAILKIKVGKHIILLVSVLPLSMMLASSLSYDAMTIIASIGFLAALLSDASLTELIIWSVLLGSVKAGGYIILVPAVFILRDRRKIGAVLLSALGSLVFFDFVLPSGALFQFGADGNGYYQASLLFQDPAEYLRMLVETYLRMTDRLFSEVGGVYLSQLEYTIPAIILVAMLFIGFLMATHETDEEKLSRTKVWYIPILLGILFTPMMLLSWTPVGQKWILGLQGRYYYPLLIPIYLLMTKRSLYIGVKKELLISSYHMIYCLECLSVFYIIRQFMTR